MGDILLNKFKQLCEDNREYLDNLPAHEEDYKVASLISWCIAFDCSDYNNLPMFWHRAVGTLLSGLRLLKVGIIANDWVEDIRDASLQLLGHIWNTKGREYVAINSRGCLSSEIFDFQDCYNSLLLVWDNIGKGNSLLGYTENKEDVIEKLKSLDRELVNNNVIVLSGLAVPILAGYKLRLEGKIGMAFTPSKEVIQAIINNRHLNNSFDVLNSAIIELLGDVEDRLIPINIEFKHLKVYSISVLDWVVAELSISRLENILKVIDNNMIQEIKSKLSIYTGLNISEITDNINIVTNEINK